MATLSTVTRHSAGDLTLYHFYFTAVSTTDAYAITNMPGAIGVWGCPYAGANTLTTFSAIHSNSSTGVTLTMYWAIACSANVFVLCQG